MVFFPFKVVNNVHPVDFMVGFNVDAVASALTRERKIEALIFHVLASSFDLQELLVKFPCGVFCN